ALSCPSQQERFLLDLAARQAFGGEELAYEIAPWDEGQSGGEIKRPGIQWVLANLDRFDELWVYDHDRLAREAYDGPAIMKQLRSRGIRLWVSTGGSDEDTPMGRFMTDLRLRFGALNREQIAERTKMNRDHRLREGLWVNHAPMGYTFVFENGEGTRRLLAPDPDTAPAVRELFRLMANGVSQKKAARQLGRNETTIIWQRDNPLYIGLVYKHRVKVRALPDLTYAGLWAQALDPDCDFLYPGRHEAIIESETWDKLQARYRAETRGRGRGRGPSATLALSGQLRCECGRKLNIHTRADRMYPMARCETCGWIRSYMKAENTILSAVALLTASKDFEREVEEAIRARNAETQSEEKIADITRRRDRVKRKLDKTIDAMLDAEELSPVLRARAGELQNEVAELEREIAAETATLKGRTAVGEWREAKRYLLRIDIGALWMASTVEEQRELLDAVFRKIEGAPDRMIFHIRGLEFPVEIPWQKRSPGSPTRPSAVLNEVAGRGIEPRTP
ncbi:MAG: recombinase family protein, partial [bacterium]